MVMLSSASSLPSTSSTSSNQINTTNYDNHSLLCSILTFYGGCQCELKRRRRWWWHGWWHGMVTFISGRMDWLQQGISLLVRSFSYSLFPDDRYASRLKHGIGIVLVGTVGMMNPMCSAVCMCVRASVHMGARVCCHCWIKCKLVMLNDEHLNYEKRMNDWKLRWSCSLAMSLMMMTTHFGQEQ